MSEPSQDISMLLRELGSGNDSVKEQLFEQLQNELKQMASALMNRERADHTLQATALVNEVCLRLLDSDAIGNATDRRYFFASANRAMRQILVDHARKRNATKRGGQYERGSLDVVLENFETSNGCRFEDLEDALKTLGDESPRQREVIELRFFSGLSIPETAEVLDVSEGTVERDWRLARAKLYHLLRDDSKQN